MVHNYGISSFNRRGLGQSAHAPNVREEGVWRSYFLSFMKAETYVYNQQMQIVIAQYQWYVTSLFSTYYSYHLIHYYLYT